MNNLENQTPDVENTDSTESKPKTVFAVPGQREVGGFAKTVLQRKGGIETKAVDADGDGVEAVTDGMGKEKYKKIMLDVWAEGGEFGVDVEAAGGMTDELMDKLDDQIKFAIHKSKPIRITSVDQESATLLRRKYPNSLISIVTLKDMRNASDADSVLGVEDKKAAAANNVVAKPEDTDDTGLDAAAGAKKQSTTAA